MVYFPLTSKSCFVWYPNLYLRESWKLLHPSDSPSAAFLCWITPLTQQAFPGSDCNSGVLLQLSLSSDSGWCAAIVNNTDHDIMDATRICMESAPLVVEVIISVGCFVTAMVTLRLAYHGYQSIPRGYHDPFQISIVTNPFPILD